MGYFNLYAQINLDDGFISTIGMIFQVIFKYSNNNTYIIYVITSVHKSTLKTVNCRRRTKINLHRQPLSANPTFPKDNHIVNMTLIY